MASRTTSKDIITLWGSAAIVSEFFGYVANSILYNRRVYSEESFDKVKKYKLTMLLMQDNGVKAFIASIISQLSECLEAGKLQRIVLVIMSKATSQVLERWNFNIDTDTDTEVVDVEVVEKGATTCYISYLTITELTFAPLLIQHQRIADTPMYFIWEDGFQVVTTTLCRCRSSDIERYNSGDRSIS